MFSDGGVSVLNRWHYENCISFKSPLTAWVNATQEVERARQILPALSDEPTVHECLTSASLGHILERSDDWWDINDHSTVEQVGADVVEKLLSKGIAWLEAMSPLEAAVSALSTQFEGISGAWSYKIEAMFGWVALGDFAQAAKQYKAALADFRTPEEMEREFGPWARGRAMDID